MKLQVNGRKLSTIFINIPGDEEISTMPNDESGYVSFTNSKEIKSIGPIIEKMKELIEFPCMNQDVLLITPYRGQAMALKTRYPDFKVETTDAVIGSESKIVVVSLVRSKSPGFLNVPERLCTTLTRAKEILIIAGNFELYRTQLKGALLSKIATFYNDHGFVFTLDEFFELVI